ncbi:hypothetical protein [Ruegeria sp.]|uniref:hypothetical protein n=1 Tax=Ruegeria sp. TaxID=1879320 RepID=UPI003B5C9B30
MPARRRMSGAAAAGGGLDQAAVDARVAALGVPSLIGAANFRIDRTHIWVAGEGDGIVLPTSDKETFWALSIGDTNYDDAIILFEPGRLAQATGTGNPARVAGGAVNRNNAVIELNVSRATRAIDIFFLARTSDSKLLAGTFSRDLDQLMPLKLWRMGAAP